MSAREPLGSEVLHDLSHRRLQRSVSQAGGGAIALGAVAATLFVLAAMSPDATVVGLLVGSGLVTLAASGVLFALMLWAEADLRRCKEEDISC